MWQLKRVSDDHTDRVGGHWWRPAEKVNFTPCCDVDLFAARHNTQLERFYSFCPDPAAEATDALTQT